jgi:hypothetical protein
MAVDPGPDAYAIFARSRAVVTAAPYPDFIQYTISVVGIDGSTSQANDYRAYSRPVDGTIDVAPISEEQAAQPPPVVHGINFAFTASICGGSCSTGSSTLSFPVGRPPQLQDLIGVPILDPTYTFGLRYPANKADKSETKTPSGLRIIATVSATNREYKITLAGTSTVDSVPSYHLLLTPLSKPKENRLRELWVGIDDYLPRRAVLAGNFTIAPLVDVPWTVKFTILDGVPFISSEMADSTLYLKPHRVVRNAVIAFEQIKTSDDSVIGRPLVEPDVTETTLIEPRDQI